MKMKSLLTGAALALATSALAGPPKNPATPTEIKCSVMPARMVNVKTATEHKMYADYKGNRYFFCCGGCPAMFKADPAKYVAGAHIPVPKAGKAAKKS